MKPVLIQAAHLIHPGSPYHHQKIDLLIENGIITEIAKDIKPNDSYIIIDAKGQIMTVGFFDLNANFGEPGYETRETLQSGIAAAISGGFTAVAIHPNTQPPIHSKSEISYLINQTRNELVDIYPLGCISYERKGEHLAELYDMYQAGAIAFTDGNRPVQNTDLMSTALLYTKTFGGLIFSYPEDIVISGKGVMNEGIHSTILGMKGIPALAEELMIVRNLYLAAYHNTKIHFSTISTKGGIELIRKAKQNKLPVTCDVAAHHLILTDDMLHQFDSLYKVKPPLRSNDDVEALLEGLKDGTIDAIVSQHTPYEPEHKNVEFEIASFGMIGIQTVLPILLRAELSPDTIVEKLVLGPRRVTGLPIPEIKKGVSANIVLFDPKAEWLFDEYSNQSKSTNSPFINQTMTGKVTFVANNQQIRSVN